MFLTDFLRKMDEYATTCANNATEKDAIDFKEYMAQLFINDDPRLYELFQTWKNAYQTHGKTYLRIPIHRTDTLELILLVWCPYSSTPVHSHPKYGCLFRVLEGTIHTQTYLDDDMSSIYKIDAEHILPKGTIDYTKGQHGIHRVFNPYPEMAFSLHLYIHRSSIYGNRVGHSISIP
jgi:predicted metal-dependent enzyme (double-stranded beta helix superfamily)